MPLYQNEVFLAIANGLCAPSIKFMIAMYKENKWTQGLQLQEGRLNFAAESGLTNAHCTLQVCIINIITALQIIIIIIIRFPN